MDTMGFPDFWVLEGSGKLRIWESIPGVPEDSDQELKDNTEETMCVDCLLWFENISIPSF